MVKKRGGISFVKIEEDIPMGDKSNLTNQWIQELEANGWNNWNDHPGYTIQDLNKQLLQYRLKIITLGHTPLYYKVVPIDLRW